jgi:DNA-binding FadR family transcriptional regulator
MSSLSVNSVNSYSQTYQNKVQQQQQDFQALGSALQSGNLSGAQTAFAALQQQLQSQSAQTTQQPSSSNSSSSNPVSSDFQTLSNALQSGNLSDAQNAFAQLQSDLQTQRGHGHHHHHGGSRGASSAPAQTSTTSSSSSSASDPNGDSSGALNVQA